MRILWLIVLALVVIAIAGGTQAHGLFWLLLVAALILGVFAIVDRGRS
jgi:hypothetical protein